MKTLFVIALLLIAGFYFIENYELVCVDKRTVKWVGVCDKYAYCVAGFTDGSVRKSVLKPYIGEVRCVREEIKNIKDLK